MKVPSVENLAGLLLAFVMTTLLLYLPFFFIIACWCCALLVSIAPMRNNYELLYLIGGVLCLVFSLISYSIEDFSDFSNYRLIIQQVIENGVDFSVRGGEVGFYILVNFLVKLIGPYERVIHYSLLVIANVILYTALYRINPRNALLVFITAQFFYLLMITPFLTRQLLSLSVVLLSISIRNFRPVLYLCAFFVHFSALIPILVLSIPQRHFRNVAFLSSILCVALILAFTIRVEVFSFLVNNGFTPSFIEPKIRFYLRLFDESKFDVLALVSAIWIVILKFRYRLIPMKDSYEKIINIYFISAILIIASINIPILPTRIGFPLYYCLPLVFIWLPISPFKLKKIDAITVLIPLAFTFFLAGYRIYINDFTKPWLLLANKDLMMSNILDYLTHFI